MTEPLAFWDGALIPASQARLALNDAGFVMGATVTDLARTVRHRLFRFPDHLARFRQSCRATGIFPPLAEEDIAARAEDLVAHNVALLPPHGDLALVLLATPGPLGYYAGLDDNGPPTFGMHTFPLSFRRYRRFFLEGVHLVVPSIRHLPSECVDPRIKQRSRMFWWQANQEARRADPAALALLLDNQGCVTETASGNILVVKDGAVLSPPRERILNGVSLHVTAELCGSLGVRFAEQHLLLYDCLNADEIMHVSTPYCLAPVSRVNGSPLAFPGGMYQRLRGAWNTALGLDYRQQILQ